MNDTKNPKILQRLGELELFGKNKKKDILSQGHLFSKLQ